MKELNNGANINFNNYGIIINKVIFNYPNNKDKQDSQFSKKKSEKNIYAEDISKFAKILFDIIQKANKQIDDSLCLKDTQTIYEPKNDLKQKESKTDPSSIHKSNSKLYPQIDIKKKHDSLDDLKKNYIDILEKASKESPENFFDSLLKTMIDQMK